MAAPRRTAGVVNLQRQLDEAFPERKKPDGWIGNEDHQLHTSSHNPDDTPGSRPEWNGDPDNIPDVRGLDVDYDLGPGVDPHAVVRHIAALPGLGRVVRYMIFDALIYHVDNGFKPRKHTGDQHPTHIHFTLAFTESADDNTTFDYRLEEIHVALTSADKSWIKATIETAVKAQMAAVPAATWAHRLVDPLSKTTPPGTKAAGDYQRYNDLVTMGAADRVIDALEPDAG
jgi:hypothetical protein